MRTALVVTAVLALALTACARGRLQSSWPDVVQARQGDAIERGWIPEFLPESTTDLREVHDPSTRQHVVMGTLPGGDLPEECKEVEIVGTPPLDADWLPTAAGSVGTPLRCGAWDGTLDPDDDDATILLWTDLPDDPTEEASEGEDTGDPTP